MIQITSFKDLDAIIEVATKLRMPPAQPINFYGTDVTFRHTHNFLKNLGSSGVCIIDVNAHNKDQQGYYPVFADVLVYGGYTFHLIYVDKIIEQSVNETKAN